MRKGITQHIVVTAQDISRGVRQKHDMCPIALAVKRTFDCISVSVAGDIRVVADGQRTLWQMPGDVRQRIITFDNGGEIEPFEFDMKFYEEDD